MITFPGYTTEIFYGNEKTTPMSAAHFFAIASMTGRYNKEVEKKMKTSNKGKRHGKY